MNKIFDTVTEYHLKWIHDIKNNKISSLNLICTSFHSRIDDYKGLLEVLKNNTSINSICIKIDYTKLSERAKQYDEWCSILSDVFKINRTLTNIRLEIYDISNKGFRYLCDGLSTNRSADNIYIVYYKLPIDSFKLVGKILKNNTYSSTINLFLENINNDAWINIIDSLKVNTTLRNFVLRANNYNADFNGSSYLKELLLVNKTIIRMEFIINNMINYEEIIDAIEKNQSIIYFRDHTKVPTHFITKQMDNYSCRNMHNNRLKAKMLQDL